jgi:hypothetical protein
MNQNAFTSISLDDFSCSKRTPLSDKYFFRQNAIAQYHTKQKVMGFTPWLQIHEAV